MKVKCRKDTDLFHVKVNFELRNNGLVAAIATKKEAASDLLRITEAIREYLQKVEIELQKIYREECVMSASSVCHVAAMIKLGNIPEDFKDWDFRDKDGWTVAHQAAVYQALPDNFHKNYPEIWGSKNNRGDSVRDVALRYGYEINNKYYYIDEIWTWVGGDINLDKVCMSDDVIQAAAKICNAKSPIFRSRLRLTVMDYETALQQSRILFSQTTVSRILLEVVHK